MNDIQNSLFEAMKVFSEAAVDNSDATITIEGTINGITDAGLGEYTAEYYGNTITVYSNTGATYSVDDAVYITVPDGDFEKKKYILGLISPTIESSSDSTSADSIYYEVSDNLVNQDFGTIKLSSYGTTYSAEMPITDLTSTYFAELFTGFLKDHNTLSFGFSAKTDLTAIQKSQGNYGITLKIPLLKSSTDGQSKETVWKAYTLDVGNMLGNPYGFNEWTPQTIYFSIDSQYTYDERYIPTIQYFCYDFPQNEENAKIIFDIWLKNIKFAVIDEISGEDTDGYSLTLKATEGIYFANTYATEKTITPLLKVNGKDTKIKTDNAEIYWFKENAEVKPGHADYVSYGGYGWQCLNSKTSVSNNDDGTQTYTYNTSAETLNVSSSEVKGDIQFKCVLVYKSKQLSAVITLKSVDASQMMTLEATEGYSTTLVKDTGYAHLTATVFIDNVTNKEKYQNSVGYSWQRYDKNGNVISGDDFYETVKNNQLVQKEINGQIRDCYETEIKIPVNEIEELNTIYCSVKLVNDDLTTTVIGTKNITLSTSTDFAFSLVINNDNVIYKYDENGNSPAGTNYSGPSTSQVSSIPALTYTLRDSAGRELTNEEYCYVKYKWIIPKDSLFTVSGYSSSDNDNYYFEGYDNLNHSMNLTYGIASRFNISKTDGAITLQVTYQGNTLSKTASVVFMKEGQEGSNGTAYSAKLVAGGLTADTSVPYGTKGANGLANNLKFVYNINRKILYRHDVATGTLAQWSGTGDRRIYTKVWRDGELLTYSTHYKVEWSLFDSKILNPCFSISDRGDGSASLTYTGGTPSIDTIYTTVVQAKITVTDGQRSVANANEIVYAYYPIDFSITNCNSVNLLPSLEDGFSEVMYASDGTNPQYANDAFDIRESRLDDLLSYLSCEWSTSSHLTNKGSGTVKPDNKYDDGQSNNYVRVKITLDDSKKTAMSNKSAELYKEIDSLNAKRTEENTNYKYLSAFKDKYKGSEWKATLNGCQGLFDIQTKAYNILDTLLNDAIQKFEDYIALQQSYTNTDTKKYCESIVNAVAQLKKSALASQQNILHLGNDGCGFDSLVNLDVIGRTSADKENYEANLGLDFTLSLELLISDINSAVYNYQSAYSSLMNYAATDFLAYYNRVRNEIKEMCNAIPDTAKEKYTTFRNKVLVLLDRFNNNTSLYAYQNILTDIVDVALQGIFVVSNGQLVISTTATQDHNDIISEYSEKLTAANSELSGFRDLLTLDDGYFSCIRPIIFYYNRYEMSNLNAWDGNKVETGDGYILAPQFGAGVKESDNSFTGVVMGVKRLNETNNVRKGLYGYSKGLQSFALDAENGAAILGKAGTGQMVVDPSSDKALIYSSNYFSNYNKNTGLPSNYNSRTGSGMCIDLTTPEIRFGNGNFVVNSSGHLTAKGGGSIAGWNISDTTLSGGGTTLNSDGTVTCNVLNANNSGSIAGWNISSNALSRNGITLSSDGSISNGSNWSISSSGTAIFNNLTANGTGSIGGWTISSNGLSAGGITIGSNGSIKSSKWAVDGAGNAVFNKITTNGTEDNSVVIAGTGNVGGCSLKDGTLTVDNAHISDLSIDKLTFQGKKVTWQDLDFVTSVRVQGAKSRSFVTNIHYDSAGAITSAPDKEVGLVGFYMTYKYCSVKVLGAGASKDSDKQSIEV